MYQNLKTLLNALFGPSRPPARHRAGRTVKATPAPVQAPERKTPDLSDAFGDDDPADLTVYEVMAVCAVNLDDSDAGRPAWRALTMLARYQDSYNGVRPNPLRTVMVDLIADMQHLTTALDMDFWSVVDEASVHFANDPDAYRHGAKL